MKSQKLLTKGQPAFDHHIKKTSPQLSSEGSHFQNQNEISLNDNPFQPDMERHSEALFKAQPEQRANFILHLQHNYGNSYVQRLLRSTAIQAKLTVSQPGDIYEQEADRVAATVTSNPLPVKRDMALQMQPEEDEVQTQPAEEEEEPIQASMARSNVIPAVINLLGREAEGENDVLRMKREVAREASVGEALTDRIMHTKGEGGPVPSTIQQTMNAHLGYDFSQVKVKTNTEAADLCQRLGARAFTHGPDIWMGQGESIHDTSLMAHELTHVAQQGAAPQIVNPKQTNCYTGMPNQLGRLPAQGMIQADPDEDVATPNFPSISSIKGDSRVKEARDQDWQAGKSDFLERFGWITWDSETKKCAVTGRKKGNEFGVSPDAPPADSHPVYMVANYHTHPPLSADMIKDQKEFAKNNNGKEMFPIGPSNADENFATGKNSPGIVEDFISAYRWPMWLTRDFKYGPNKRT